MFNFFKKPAFGLDISDHSIEALQIKRKFGRLYLGAYGRIRLEEGIVGDGKILKKEKLKEKMKELLQTTEPRRIRSKEVILSVPESKTFFHIFQVSRDLKDEALRKTLADIAAKTIPFEDEKIYWDFVEISDREKLGPETLYFKSVLYVGILKEIVDDYLEVLEGVGLKPRVVDIESASLARAFKNEEVKGGGMLIADIGARTTVLTIIDEGSIRFSATVPVAGNHFTQAISEKFKVSLKEAERLKEKCGLDPRKEEGKIMLILQNTLQEVLEEIKKTIGFYEEKSGRQIKKVLICGGSSFIPKLSSYFASNLGIETQIPDPWEGIDVEKLFKNKKLKGVIKTRFHPIFFSNVIGLAKRGLEKEPEKAGINLIPPEKRPKPAFIGRKLARSKTFKSFTTAFTILILAFFGWVIYKYVFKGLFPEIYHFEVPLFKKEEEFKKEEKTTEEEPSEGLTPIPEEEVIVEEEEIVYVIIKETETGWLRVREGPDTDFAEITKVYPGESYPLLEEKPEWYKIKLKEDKEGWISKKYASKQ